MSEDKASFHPPERRKEAAKNVGRKNHPSRIHTRKGKESLFLNPIWALAATTGIAWFGGPKIAEEVFAESPPPLPAASRDKPEPGSGPQLIDTRNHPPSEVEKGSHAEKTVTIDDVKEIISPEKFDKLLNLIEDEQMRESARTAIPILVEAFAERGYTENEILAFTFANVEHESMFESMEEINGAAQAEEYGYDGGMYGRGYLQLTGEENYRIYGERLGYDFVNHPELLLDPYISAKVVVDYFVNRGIIDMILKGELLEARLEINPGERDSNDEVFFRTPYNIRERTKEFLSVLNGPNNSGSQSRWDGAPRKNSNTSGRNHTG